MATTSATVAEVPITETYRDVEHMIYHMVQKFITRFGGDFEELVGEANYAFLKAYNSFNQDRGRFTTNLGNVIWNRLIDHRFKGHEHRRRKLGALSFDAYCAEKASGQPCRLFEMLGRNDPQFRLDEFLEELAEDAQTIVKLILESPMDFAAYAALATKGGQPRCWRPALKRYLRGLGWSAARIKDGFEEIAIALYA